MFWEKCADFGQDRIEWRFEPWPQVPSGGVEVEFRLLYDGSLRAASHNSTADKHRIRRTLSPQLAELWKTHPGLVNLTSSADAATKAGYAATPAQQRRYVNFERCGRNFFPTIANRDGVACGLDILFLRRDHPGNLIHSGGDIDNRIKVLFDALRLPSGCDEVVGPPDDDPNPFFCLLEDDRLITEVRVETDRLLTPLGSDEHKNDVRLVINVRTILINSTGFGYPFS